jgi:uncharacterized protein DUF4349
MRSQRLISTAIGAVVIGLVLIGCSGAASAPLQPISGGIERPAGQPAAGDTGGNGDQTAGGNSNEFALSDSNFIVREGTVEVEVKDLSAALQQAKTLVGGLGGYVAGSKESNDGDYRYAAITYRFPVERWDEALAGLRALGQRVISENTTATDVTADVVDMDARLANLRAAETQYQAIMAKAISIDDVLAVQRQLTDVRGQIEQLQAQRDSLANRATLATITVNWQVPVTAVATVNQGWDLGHEVDRAFAALFGFGQSLATLAVWLLIAVMPIVVPTVLVGLVLYRVLRPRINRVTIDQTPAADA